MKEIAAFKTKDGIWLDAGVLFYHRKNPSAVQDDFIHCPSGRRFNLKRKEMKRL
jgi:hypothetical protein